jgi:hypothetical protein
LFALCPDAAGESLAGPSLLQLAKVIPKINMAMPKMIAFFIITTSSPRKGPWRPRTINPAPISHKYHSTIPRKHSSKIQYAAKANYPVL